MEDIFYKMEAYAGDMKETSDRFLNDAELYGACLKDFMDDEGFEALDKAICDKNFDSAFDCAHSLKGVSGNLGLKPVYKSVCSLVEVLRAKKYDQVDESYKKFKSDTAQLYDFVNGVL